MFMVSIANLAKNLQSEARNLTNALIVSDKFDSLYSVSDKLGNNHDKFIHQKPYI